MKTYVKKLSEDMLREVQDICLENNEIVTRARQCFLVTKQILQKLKEFLSDYQFMNDEEEILFFKELKPSLQKENIFWSEIFYIESKRPKGDKKTIEKYYLNHIWHINEFFQRNYILYTYYITDFEEENRRLFLRKSDSDSLFPEYEDIDLDNNFSTINSYKIARFMALEEVTTYLSSNLDLLRSNVRSDTSATDLKPMVFTGTKAQFIEWVLGTHYSGVLNNGKSTIKETFAYFQNMLSIKVANHYGYFQSMRIRKKVRTPFLRLMVHKTEQRMDENDEFPRFG